MTIPLKSTKEIECIAQAGKILAKILKSISREARIGVKLSQLNKLAYELTKKQGAKPAFLGYQPDGASKPFGASICASVNEVVVHGFPSDYKLKSGDILKIDFGIEYKKFFADAAITLGIGDISSEAKHLIEITRLALEKAIKRIRPGGKLSDISLTIQRMAENNGLKIIKSLTGHGIGRALHEEPTIYNFVIRRSGKKAKEEVLLRPGMVLAIEPMLAITTEKIIQRPDESWATADGSLSAHFEHTAAITQRGARILTRL